MIVDAVIGNEDRHAGERDQGVRAGAAEASARAAIAATERVHQTGTDQVQGEPSDIPGLKERGAAGQALVGDDGEDGGGAGLSAERGDAGEHLQNEPDAVLGRDRGGDEHGDEVVEHRARSAGDIEDVEKDAVPDQGVQAESDVDKGTRVR